MLSSAKLWTTETVLKKNKLFIEMLKESGLRIKPCGTPEMIFSKELYVLLMRTHCLQNCLQDTAPQVSNKLDIDIESSNIKDCLWIPGIGSKRVFIKFSKRKDANNSSLKEKPEGKEFDFTWHFFSNTFLTAASASITKCFGKNGKNYWLIIPWFLWFLLGIKWIY